MFSFGYKVLLSVFAASLILSIQNTEAAKADGKCVRLLRRLLKNPPQNTTIVINTRLSKARYRCHKGFKLVGKPERTCKKGRWVEKKEPKCLGSVKTCPLPDIPFSSYIAQPANYNRTYKTGDTITLACKKGFEIQPGSIPVRVCINGRWKKFRFKCKCN